jgi:hypothetical protein
MANAKIIESGRMLMPKGVRASPRGQTTSTRLASNGTESHLTGSRGRTNLQSKSHVETNVTSIFVPNSHEDIIVGARREYCYPSARRDGPNSENCCRYCGNLTTSYREISRKLLSDKQLDFPKSGP